MSAEEQFAFCPCGERRDSKLDFHVKGSTSGLVHRTQLIGSGKLDGNVSEFNGYGVRACRSCATVYVDMSPMLPVLAREPRQEKP